jgi:hypothetical protein
MSGWRPALAILVLAACSRTPAAARPAAPASVARPLVLDDLLAGPADLTLTLRPPAIVRDRVYGPLLRRASALAAAYAGPRTVGTTALVALERTEEVLAALGGAGQALVLMRGVPADLDVTQVVDEGGRALWKTAQGDVRQTFVEYESANGAETSQTALFVLPQRTWIVVAGDARGRTREMLIRAAEAPSFAPADVSLAELSIRGGALVRRDERLRDGALAPLGRSLVRASVALTPGALGILVATLSYSDSAAAGGAEETARAVVAAFRRRLEQLDSSGTNAASPPKAPPPLSWLAAAGVERAGSEVHVRAPIPKAWLDAIAQADVSGAASDAPSVSKTGGAEVPWALWHRSASAPTLSPPSVGLPGSPRAE